MRNQSEIVLIDSLNLNVIHLLAFLFCLIEIVGILGNLLVIVSVEFDSRMRRSLTNQLIVRVGTCDLIILIFNIPDLIQFVSSINGNWILDEYSCKIIRTVLVLAQYASVLTMCALTIERFIGIVYPLRGKFLRERKHVVVITILVWLVSLICAAPNLVYLQIVENEFQSRRSCLLIYSKDDIRSNQIRYLIHKSMEYLIFYFLPLILQMYSYIRIAKRLFYVDETLQTSFSTVNRNQSDDQSIDFDENSSGVHRAQRFLSKPKSDSTVSNSPMGRRSTVTYNALKSRRNVIKMLFIVVFIYFLSFSPQVIVFLLFETNAIQNIPKFIQTPYFVAFTMLLVTISSASNPIVYAIFCSKFRQSFAKILRKLVCCCQKSSNYPTTQRNLSLQQVPKATFRFDKRNSLNENKFLQTNRSYSYSS